MLFLKSNKGFTLTELIVAISVLAVVLTIASTSLFFISASDRKLRLSKEVYEDTRFLMERIVKEVRRGTVDYEEYWNMKVISSGKYGENFGEYAKQFIDPGLAPDGVTTDEYGTRCINNETGEVSEKSPPCPEDYPNVYLPSIDKNRGQNPYKNSGDSANAVCDTGDCTDVAHHIQDELLLIYSNGLTKSIIKRIGDEDERIGLLRLTRDDQYTLEWENHLDFPDIGDVATNNDDFISITPPGIEIVDLKFYIAPLEDPRKAFNEHLADIQHQPQVTIILAVQASDKRMMAIRGVRPKISLQTTVTTRVYRDMPSYIAK